MGQSYFLVALVLLAGIGILFFRRRRQERLTLTEHTVRCPVNDCRATVAVRTDSAAPPSSRYLDVTACSLLSSAPFVPPTRRAYFSDMPTAPYPYEVDHTPLHSDEVRCSKRCLVVLTAAESPAGVEPVSCTAGMNDALEMARQTQSPAMMRVMWTHSA